MKKSFTISIMLMTMSNINASGFESAFKHALKKNNTSRTTSNQSPSIPVARPITANDIQANIPQVTAQIIEDKTYYSIHPEIQNVILSKMKQEGTFDTTLIEVACSLINAYKKIQERRTPYLIDSTRRDELDLVPHLHSILTHLNGTTQTPKIISMKQQIQTTIHKINP